MVTIENYSLTAFINRVVTLSLATEKGYNFEEYAGFVTNRSNIGEAFFNHFFGQGKQYRILKDGFSIRVLYNEHTDSVEILIDRV